MILSILLICFAFFFVIISTASIAHGVILLFLFLVGLACLLIFKQNKKCYKLFSISYSIYSIYAAILYFYMTYRGFDYLQSFDGINVYIPYTIELLSLNLDFFSLISEIYTVSKYSFVGSILVPFVYVGKLSEILNGDLYFSIQQTIVFFAAVAIPVVYRILEASNLKANIYKYTLLYALVSPHLYMSAFIVRDMPITLSYYLLTYLTFKPLRIKYLIIFALLIGFISSLRLSSGIFASLFLFIYLWVNFVKSKPTQRAMSGLALVFCLALLVINVPYIHSVTSEKLTVYSELQIAAQDGQSTVAILNNLPPVLSHAIKAVYNQVMPIPSWRTMIETTYRPEAYNIMNFHIVVNTFFQFSILTLLLIGAYTARIWPLKENLTLKYLLLLGILFLMLQSSTLGHRRMMGVYPIFYTLAIIYFHSFSHKSKIQFVTIALFLFSLLQISGLYKVI